MMRYYPTGCLLAALCSLTSGCGAINDLRAHDIAMTIEAVKSIPRAEGTPITIGRECDDALERLALLQRDFPRPTKGRLSKIERHSEQDEEAFFSYSGLVAKREARRETWGKINAPFKAAWDTTTWLLKYGWIVALVVVVLGLVAWIKREFFHRDVVTVKHLQAVVGDKEQRRQIAAGTPVGRVYDKVRGLLIPSVSVDRKVPTDALQCDKSDTST